MRHIRTEPDAFTLFPADAPLPDHAGLRCIPLTDPTPLYVWSPAWCASSRHPALDTVQRGFTEAGRNRRWPDYTAT